MVLESVENLTFSAFQLKFPLQVSEAVHHQTVILIALWLGCLYFLFCSDFTFSILTSKANHLSLITGHL